MDQLAKAQTEMNARSIDLLAVADGLGRTAVESCKANMVCSLVEDELLVDLKRLQEYLASALGVPADLQLVAEAALNWLTRHFELTEHLRRGQTLEVPAPQMGEYELDGPQPDPGGSLVQLRVMTPGWKRRGRSIIPPRVTALPAAPEVADTAASAPEVPPSEGNYF